MEAATRRSEQKSSKRSGKGNINFGEQHVIEQLGG
jgi:hypothetical protein